MEAILMNDTVRTLTARNADFAQHSFVPGASMMPALKTMVMGCADPRVDPAHVLGLANGDALVIRDFSAAAAVRLAAISSKACAKAASRAAGMPRVATAMTS
jgi:carbonic anhydrase